MLHSVEYSFLTDVSGQSIGLICKGKEVQEGGNDKCTETSYGVTTIRCVTSQKSSDLVYLAVEG